KHIGQNFAVAAWADHCMADDLLAVEAAIRSPKNAERVAVHDGEHDGAFRIRHFGVGFHVADPVAPCLDQEFENGNEERDEQSAEQIELKAPPPVLSLACALLLLFVGRHGYAGMNRWD